MSTTAFGLPAQPPIPPFPHTPPSAQNPYWCTECVDYCEHPSEYHKRTLRRNPFSAESRRLALIQSKRRKYRKTNWVKEIRSDPAFIEMAIYGARAAIGFLRIFS